ncbi:MAG: hypothetical protein Q8P85_10300 [Pseudomonas sp.]|nr:hypothetical protein [Pseudomonas sp.]
MEDIRIECCKRKCKHVHMHSERVKVLNKSKERAGLGMSDLVCPKCGGKEYYRLDQTA